MELKPILLKAHGNLSNISDIPVGWLINVKQLSDTINSDAVAQTAVRDAHNFILAGDIQAMVWISSKSVLHKAKLYCGSV